MFALFVSPLGRCRRSLPVSPAKEQERYLSTVVHGEALGVATTSSPPRKSFERAETLEMDWVGDSRSSGLRRLKLCFDSIGDLQRHPHTKHAAVPHMEATIAALLFLYLYRIF